MFGDIDWNNVITELIGLVVGTSILALLGGLGIWLKQAYKRLTSIDLAVQELHTIARMVQDHEARLSAIEDWKAHHKHKVITPPSELYDDLYE